MKVFFVILHYQALNETYECIDSILKLYKDVNIVIVDNNSPNKSGDEIKKHYRINNNIEVIINSENMGFARGNNVGYRYAKEHGADFIIQVNNDTIFEDENFIVTLQNLFESEKYAVLGPDVICIKNGQHQNPLKGFDINSKSILWKLAKNIFGYVLATINLDNKIKNENVYQPEWNKFVDISSDSKKVLQGCCYIFSPLYIEVIDGMFEGTFMYYEEYFLDYICKQKNLKMIYSPDLFLKHLRKAATSAVVVQGKEKRKFKYKNSIISLWNFYKAYLKK